MINKASKELSSVHPDQKPIHGDWYLVHTKPMQETLAMVNLQRQGYYCYLPFYQNTKQKRQEPLFPRYLFVSIDAQAEARGLSPIRATRGVSTLVQFGQFPAKVDPNLIQLLQNHEERCMNSPFFTRGEKVVITSGPFSGIEAVFLVSSSSHRSTVLIEFLSNAVNLAVETTSLRKVGPTQKTISHP